MSDSMLRTLASKSARLMSVLILASSTPSKAVVPTLEPEDEMMLANGLKGPAMRLY